VSGGFFRVRLACRMQISQILSQHKTVANHTYFHCQTVRHSCEYRIDILNKVCKTKEVRLADIACGCGALHSNGIGDAAEAFQLPCLQLEEWSRSRRRSG
jgi:hypothetical protein